MAGYVISCSPPASHCPIHPLCRRIRTRNFEHFLFRGMRNLRHSLSMIEPSRPLSEIIRAYLLGSNSSLRPLNSNWMHKNFFYHAKTNRQRDQTSASNQSRTKSESTSCDVGGGSSVQRKCNCRRGCSLQSDALL